jgi:lipopolysaccharide cholinephosphotransferase
MEITPEKLRKLQLLELEILLELKQICEKHSIPFILIGGTLIGAVRHNGFIPWDDDVDIGMLREHFDKFCKIAPNELSEKYFLQTPETDNTCGSYCIARVRLKGTKFVVKTQPKNWKHIGFCIDIFPYENIPDSNILGYLYWSVFNVLKRVYSIRLGYRPHPPKLIYRVIMRLGIILFLPISTRTLKSFLEMYHKKYENLNSKYVVLLSGSWGFRNERHLRETVIKTTSLPFEGTFMPVPGNYDLFLREQYGDYMTPPPEDKRNARHVAEIDFGIY